MSHVLGDAKHIAALYVVVIFESLQKEHGMLERGSSHHPPKGVHNGMELLDEWRVHVIEFRVLLWVVYFEAGVRIDVHPVSSVLNTAELPWSPCIKVCS